MYCLFATIDVKQKMRHIFLFGILHCVFGFLICTTLSQTTVVPATSPAPVRSGYCPNGTVSVQPSGGGGGITPGPLVQAAKKPALKPPGVFGLTSPFKTPDPTQNLNPPPPPTAARLSILPPPPACVYNCSSDDACENAGDKCCVQGCQQVCKAALPEPVERRGRCDSLTLPKCRQGTVCVNIGKSNSRCDLATCKTLVCAADAQCLELESGAICDAPLHNGTCPAPSYYGYGYANCSGDSQCQDNEKCCKSQQYGFVCTPITRPPISCSQVACFGNRQCRKNRRTGKFECIKNRRGQCPYYDVLYGLLTSRGEYECKEECADDFDCPGNMNKCCQVGCSKWCLMPDLSNTCSPGVKKCERGFDCVESEYGYSTCVSKKPGLCPYSSFTAIFPCIGNDKPGACGVDYDCPGNQKCCRPNYCKPSSCVAPATNCTNQYCNYDESCQVPNSIAQCVKGLCPTSPAVKPACPKPDAFDRNRCSSNANCQSSFPYSVDRACCPDSCGINRCVESGVYCGGQLVCPARDLCLYPFYPVDPNFACYSQ